MKSTVKLNEDVLERLDKLQERLDFKKRSPLVHTLLRNALDIIEVSSYEEFLKIKGKAK